MTIEKKSILTPDGSKIFYEVSGSGFPLFLLHGNGGSSDYFKHQVPVFSQYFKVYTIDFRGHGKSTNTQKFFSFDLLSDDIYLITVKEKIHFLNILGFSDGANAAMFFASKYPNKVNKLILNAGNTSSEGLSFLIQLGIHAEYSFYSFLGLFSQKWKQYKERTKLMLKDTGITTEDLQHISAKTLVIVGKQDIIKLSHSLYIAEEIPDSSFVLVSGQGHLFAKKNPLLFNQSILTFLLENR
ncbi:alpha/beta hydrolase [Enterococcus sp. BWT-B8]|uniref:alpha/beta fold hydrolase n=1 Tax=Enterococcus sp. BWT-B8 TaxID=2885157 RepID=UPI001E3FD496|nr:alpha/beta hydrolase [Enterococcus sp. BWT-B8]MCB5950736.1 alpha/beta hydrolase [Enterococcus sp. BWT-B8]